MSAIHTMKVVPNSEAEKRFMELLKKVDVKPDSVICKLGDVFGVPYNEYILSDGLFRQIQDELRKVKKI